MLKPSISIIIPVKNEEDSVKPLFEGIKRVFKKVKKSYQVIFVDDGSTDNTVNSIKDILKKNKQVTLIKLRGNFGKSLALQSGFEYASGKVVITMDGDLQDDPTLIPAFLSKIDQGYDLVSGWKKVRHDPLSKKIPSRILNYVVRILTGVKLHDINCGFKAYTKELTEKLHLYGELYRFIPIIAAKQNFKITEIVVQHKARIHGKTKYNWTRNIKGLLDLLTVVFLTGYINRPGHFFGLFGLISFFFGFIIGLYITYLRLTTGSIQYRHPLLFLGMLLMIIGVQLLSTGLVAEMIVSFNKNKTSSKEFIKEIANK